MLNLQTVAETLGTVCDGRAWVFVTSQADLEGVLGAFKGMAAQDITKIMGRFKTQLTLAERRCPRGNSKTAFGEARGRARSPH